MLILYVVVSVPCVYHVSDNIGESLCCQVKYYKASYRALPPLVLWAKYWAVGLWHKGGSV